MEKKDFIVKRTITMIDGKPHVETYSEEELIRCEDCIFGLQCIQPRNDNLDFDYITCSKPYVGIGCANHKPDWFCADAKPKIKKQEDIA